HWRGMLCDPPDFSILHALILFPGPPGVACSAGGDGGGGARGPDHLGRGGGRRGPPLHRADLGFLAGGGGRPAGFWPFMKTKTYFVFRVNIWDDTGDSIVEHVAGVDDFEVAEATYRAAVARWPAARITLRQGIRVVHDTG